MRVRRARWSVVDVRSYDRCELVTLAGLGPGNSGVTLRVIQPFDLLEPIDQRARPKPIRPTLWRRACRALVAAQSPPGGLETARQATIDLLPYQLEPALALVRGRGSRVLLADDVGLGKTIQAALIISELRARGAADRVLILTPPGLRDQWSRELGRRFEIDSRVVDVAALRRRMATMPVGVNPWTTIPVAVASIDYIKRPEVLADLLLCTWEVVVVDEAHNAVGGTDRHSAIAALASRASYVVLVSATPHSGDRDGSRRFATRDRPAVMRSSYFAGRATTSGSTSRATSIASLSGRTPTRRGCTRCSSGSRTSCGTTAAKGRRSRLQYCTSARSRAPTPSRDRLRVAWLHCLSLTKRVSNSCRSR